MTFFKTKVNKGMSGAIILFSILFSSILWFWDSPEHTRFIYFRDNVLLISAVFSVYFLIKSIKENSPITISVLDIIFLLTSIYFILKNNDFSFQNEFLTQFILLFSFYFSIKTYKNNLRLIHPITVSLISILFILSVIAAVECVQNLIKGRYPNIPAYNFKFSSALTDYMILGSVLMTSYYYYCLQNKKNVFKGLNPYLFVKDLFLFVAIIVSLYKSSLLFITAIIINTPRIIYEKLNKTRIIVVSSFLILLIFMIIVLKQQNIIFKSLRYFPISMNAAKVNLISGTGLGTFNRVYNTAQSDYFNYKFNNVGSIWENLMAGNRVSIEDRTGYLNGKVPFIEFLVADNMRTPENEYIKILLETGITGLALILLSIGLFVYGFYKLKDKKNNAITGFTLAVIALLIGAFFSFPFHETPLMMIMALMLGIVVNNLGFKNYFIIEKGNRFVYASIILLTIVASIGFWKSMTVKNAWRVAALEAKKGNFAEEKYKNLFPELKNNSEFLKNYGTELTKSKNYNESIKLLDEAMHYTLDGKILCTQADNYFQINQLEKAKNVYQIATNILPTDIYPRYCEMNFYLKTGDTVTAIKKARVITDIDVTYNDKDAHTMKKETILLLDSLQNSLEKLK